jgi:exodeoxyribonuclease VII small subunit
LKIEELPFEEAIERLEKIVNELEDEKISLDMAMEKFEEGVKLSSHCLDKLNEAEKKIEELTRSEDGQLIAKEIDIQI